MMIHPKVTKLNAAGNQFRNMIHLLSSVRIRFVLDAPWHIVSVGIQYAAIGQ
jgi:hypothetical protein